MNFNDQRRQRRTMLAPTHPPRAHAHTFTKKSILKKELHLKRSGYNNCWGTNVGHNGHYSCKFSLSYQQQEKLYWKRSKRITIGQWSKKTRSPPNKVKKNKSQSKSLSYKSQTALQSIKVKTNGIPLKGGDKYWLYFDFWLFVIYVFHFTACDGIWIWICHTHRCCNELLPFH